MPPQHPRRPRIPRPRNPWELPSIRTLHFPLSLSPRWKVAMVPCVKGDKRVMVPQAILKGHRVKIQSIVVRCKARNLDGTIFEDIAFQIFFRRDAQWLINPSLHNLTGLEWKGDMLIAKVGLRHRNAHVSLTSEFTPLALEVVKRFVQYVDTEHTIPETLVFERTVAAPPAPPPAPAPPAPVPAAPAPAPTHAHAEPANHGPRARSGVRDLTRGRAPGLTAETGAMVLRSRRAHPSLTAETRAMVLRSHRAHPALTADTGAMVLRSRRAAVQ